MCPEPEIIATILPKISSDLPNKPPNIYPAEYIQEAQLLLGYVARNGLDVDETIVANIVQAKGWLEQKEWDPEKEIRFWNSFNMLSKIVQPVSVASLKADATSTVGFYQKWSIFVLAILLLMQVYLLMGSSRYEKVAELPPKVEQLIERLEIEIESVPPEQRAENRKINTLTAEIDQYQDQLTANYRLLNEWSLKSLWQFAFPFSWSEEKSVEPVNGSPVEVKILLQEKEFILKTVQSYILPLLYGLLGASAFVLRTLNTEIKNLTYVTTSNISYRLRIQLGALSGLAIGWFTGFDSPLSFGSLSPFALAFIAGYSVELLFTAMDRLIAAFSAEKNTVTVVEKQIKPNSSRIPGDSAQ
ncbi:MAG: hypothetical protein BWK79_03130 [Beggiatoa sp. IS2]|nr:MAG: hypothetical protein BWK79_03130 [Beggiatoa sp. IS2]